ncbi:uncharacterized protein LOC144497491 [Mustelus asterias]
MVSGLERNFQEVGFPEHTDWRGEEPHINITSPYFPCSNCSASTTSGFVVILGLRCTESRSLDGQSCRQKNKEKWPQKEILGTASWNPGFGEGYVSCSWRSVSPLSWIAALKRNMERREWHPDDRDRNCGSVSNTLNPRKSLLRSGTRERCRRGKYMIRCEG